MIEVPMANCNKIAIVDDIDSYVLQRVWRAYEYKEGAWYVKSGITQLHRLILQAPRGVLVDHKDRDGLNNRRSNLRLCSISESNRNRGGQRNSTSRYRGVSSRGSRWVAMIRIEGKNRRLGTFDKEEDAAKVYNEAAKKAFGEFAFINEVL